MDILVICQQCEIVMFGVIFYRFIFDTIWFLVLSNNAYCYRFEPNTFTFNCLSECPGSENFSVHANYTAVEVARNKFDMSGEIIFREFLGGKIDVGFINEILTIFSFIASNNHAAM